MVGLGGEQGLGNDVDEDLLAIGLHLAHPAHLADRTDHAQRERMDEVPGIAVGPGAEAELRPASSTSRTACWIWASRRSPQRERLGASHGVMLTL